jgi:metal-responsive CopG/Arc/MetJ family transcriptional regulator
MKTAVSIPDELFMKAEKVAKRRCVSRSQLYAEAIRRFVAEDHRQAIVGQFNRVYGGAQQPLEPAARLAQSRAIGKEQW